MSTKTFLISGATGQQGGTVARVLLSKGHKVRGLTRNTQSDAARALASLGAEVVRADFDDAASLDAALDGMDAFYLMSTPFEGGVDLETSQGVAGAEAAKRAGVDHLVFSSVADANRKTGVPHFDSKYTVEERIANLGIPYTIVAPVYFYQNMLAPYVLPGLQQGVFAQALPESRKLQMISVTSIGEFTAHVLENRDAFLNRRINIAGDELDGTQITAVISKASGRELAYQAVPVEAVRQTSEDMALMYDWFDHVGYSADISALRKAYPDINWETFEQWASNQDWSLLSA